MANSLIFAGQTLTDANLFGGITYIADLNVGDEFSIGNTASASVTFETNMQLPLYTKDNTNGTFTWERDEVTKGRFYITEVTKLSGRYHVTAYDAMYLLEAKVSELSVTPPVTVTALASAVASYRGCTVSGTINNGTISVSSLDKDMSIRELLGYIAEASGCSVKINGSDQLCFVYYADSGISVTASEYVTLEAADYSCDAIDSVVILDENGEIQAEAGSGTNTLYIGGNPILSGANNDNAQAILNAVKDFVYVPLTCEMFVDHDIEIGTIATFGGIPTLVMHIESSEGGATASSVGSDNRAEYNKGIVTPASYVLNVYTEFGDSTVTHTAELLKNGEDITDRYANDLEWSYLLNNAYSFIGNGRSITVSQADYAHSVTVTWTRRKAQYLVNNAGNHLVTSTGAKLMGRTEY